MVSVAEVIRSRIRKNDISARWGGEEFMILLPETGMEGGKIVAESIRSTLSQHPFSYKEQELKITMTFGVSVFENGYDIDDCIRLADQAMYKGKTSGKDCIITFSQNE